MEKIRKKFLDYTIVNSGNSDGWVITKPEGQLYECNLGNYGSLDDAKRACVLYFMIARPDVFATTIYYRTIGIGGQYMEFALLRSQLKKEQITLPKGLKEVMLKVCDDGGMCEVLTFKKERIGYKYNIK